MSKNLSWYTMQADGATAKIKIHNEIGGWGISAEQFSADLDKMGPVAKLEISINSPGGEVFDGFAIYNMLRRHTATKEVTVEGVAASVASIIAMAGDVVRMPSNAFLMIHNPMLWMAGGADDLRHAAELLDKIKKNAMEVYQRRAKDIGDVELSEMMDAETWLTAEEAVLKGFADSIEDPVAEPEEGARLDSKFSKIPAACMCYFRPKNTDDGAAGSEPGDNAGGDAAGGDDHTAGTDDPPPVDPETIQDENTNDQPFSTGVNTMSLKEIIAKINAGREKIDTEISGLVSMVTEKFGAEQAAVLKAKLTADTRIDCEEAEQIEARVSDIVAKAKQATTDFVLASLQSIPAKPATVELGTDEREKFLDAAGVVLQHRAGNKVDEAKLADVRKQGFGQMGLQSFCREILARNGIKNAMHIPAGQVYDELCRIRPQMGNGQGSGDFSNVFADVANKVLAREWEAAPTTYQAFVANDTINDFRTKNIVRVSEAGDVLEMKEGEGFPYTSVKDSKETASLLTVGVAWGISRKAIINDDLNALITVPAKLARSVRRYVNRAVYTGIYGTNMAGPTMTETGAALLSSTHNNFVADTSGAAPSTATLATLRQKMMKQTLPAPDGGQSTTQYTNIPPSFILYHSNHDILVNQLIRATYDTDTAGQFKPNMPFIQRLIPIWDPVLDELMAAATDPHTGWYLLASPADLPTVTVYTLTGAQMPTLRQKVSDVAEPLGTTWDIYYDVGIGYNDYRGIAGNYGE